MTLLLYYSLRVFTPTLADTFHCSLSDSKSSQISKTILSILANFSIAIVWMDTAHPLITKPLVIVSSAPIVTYETVLVGDTSYWYHQPTPSHMLHRLFQFSRKVQVLVSFSFSFDFHSVVCRDSKIHFQQVLFFLARIR